MNPLVFSTIKNILCLHVSVRCKCSKLLINEKTTESFLQLCYSWQCFSDSSSNIWTVVSWFALNDKSRASVFGKSNKYFLELLLWFIFKILTRVMGRLHRESFLFYFHLNENAPQLTETHFKYKNNATIFNNWNLRTNDIKNTQCLMFNSQIIYY